MERMSKVLAVCPTCGQPKRKPKTPRFTVEGLPVTPLEQLPRPWDPSWRLVATLVKPTTFDKDGRAIGLARVKREYRRDNTWADMRYGHSPFDRPKDEIERTGTLEQVQLRGKEILGEQIKQDAEVGE